MLISPKLFVPITNNFFVKKIGLFNISFKESDIQGSHTFTKKIVSAYIKSSGILVLHFFNFFEFKDLDLSKNLTNSLNGTVFILKSLK